MPLAARSSVRPASLPAESLSARNIAAARDSSESARYLIRREEILPDGEGCRSTSNSASPASKDDSGSPGDISSLRPPPSPREERASPTSEAASARDTESPVTA